MSASWVVITSIAPPTGAVRAFSQLPGWELVVVGDRKTPPDWAAPGARYLSVDAQLESDWKLSALLPWNHYCRKNVGYLHALAAGADRIAESDDDNVPLEGFLSSVEEQLECEAWTGSPWVNVYRFFSDDLVWPRGYPLELIREQAAETSALQGSYRCPVQQFLADGDPDVDAVYRLTVGKDDHRFRDGTVALAPGAYTPFNSQSTLWFPVAFPLLYLPSHVSFRMTDIWRSFVAQACLHALGAHLAYHGPGVRQDRNVHDLLRDFRDEVPGYLANTKIVDVLRALALDGGEEAVAANLLTCYRALVEAGHVPAEELPLVEAWLEDVQAARAGVASAGRG